MKTLLCAIAALFVSIGLATAQEGTKLNVKVGDKAPAISLPATQVEKALPGSTEKMLSLKDLQGKKNVVLFFYPKAMTKGCTIESCGFSKMADKFGELDTVVIGISTDPLDKQAQFTQKENLTIPLLADNEMKLAKALGVMSEKGSVTKRVTFVIDKEGTIRKIYEKVTPSTHPEEVLTFIKEMGKK